MKCKLYIIIALLLPTLLTAQEKLVQVPTCEAGVAFTIRIPINAHGMTVQYAWYRNDTLIAGTEKILMPNENKIAYTIPAEQARGNAVYYFKYLLHDDFPEWTMSRKYALSFSASGDCTITVGAISGSDVVTEPLPHPLCTITVGAISGSDAVTEPTPHPLCVITVGSISGSDVVTEPVPHPLCTITVGTISGSDVVTEPLPHPLCTITVGAISGSDVVSEPLPHPLCTITVGAISGSDAVTEPTPHPLCVITVGAISGSDVAEPTPHPPTVDTPPTDTGPTPVPNVPDMTLAGVGYHGDRSIVWAAYNVDNYQTFAVRPDMYTKFFQWNSSTAWAASGEVTGWNDTPNEFSDEWTINPCPTGWRLPGFDEFSYLQNSVSTWADANTKGNAVAGRFYGPNSATCTLPNNMTGCIFLPAGGYRDGEKSGVNGNSSWWGGGQGFGGCYWSRSAYNFQVGNNLTFDSNSTNNSGTNTLYTFGLNLRCVQDVE